MALSVGDDRYRFLYLFPTAKRLAELSNVVAINLKGLPAKALPALSEVGRGRDILKERNVAVSDTGEVAKAVVGGPVGGFPEFAPTVIGTINHEIDPGRQFLLEDQLRFVHRTVDGTGK